MNIYFRVDFGKYIGFGHLSRCMVLADLFASKNHNVCFLHHTQEGANPENFHGHKHEILGTGICPTEFSTTNYDTWLGHTQEQECLHLSKFVTTPAIWIIDHYGISSVVEQYLKKHHQHVVVIDDLKRTHYADLIIDYSTASTRQQLQERNLYKGESLSGKDFCIASMRYAQMRKQSYHQVRRILVNLGSTTSEMVLKVCLALDSLFSEFILAEVQVLYKSGRPQEFNSQNQFTFIPTTKALDKMNLEADLVIGSFGVALIERIVQCVPCVNFLVVDNQKDFSTIFNNDNLHSFCGDLRHLNVLQIQALIRHEIQRFNNVVTQNLKCACGIDGQGAFRIVEKLEAKFAAPRRKN
ncbi:MAG: hypothetical protein A2X86_12360 [Bdellovibrionales bacterium GWA2_49_15]|nr:MAG: hypothetical protein A2X86_12360 [Bdellovibrionales bacterium GWA2_49_15]